MPHPSGMKARRGVLVAIALACATARCGGDLVGGDVSPTAAPDGGETLSPVPAPPPDAPVEAASGDGYRRHVLRREPRRPRRRLHQPQHDAEHVVTASRPPLSRRRQGRLRRSDDGGARPEDVAVGDQSAAPQRGQGPLLGLGGDLLRSQQRRPSRAPVGLVWPRAQSPLAGDGGSRGRDVRQSQGRVRLRVRSARGLDGRRQRAVPRQRQPDGRGLREGPPSAVVGDLRLAQAVLRGQLPLEPRWRSEAVAARRQQRNDDVRGHRQRRLHGSLHGRDRPLRRRQLERPGRAAVQHARGPGPLRAAGKRAARSPGPSASSASSSPGSSPGAATRCVGDRAARSAAPRGAPR